MRTSSGSLQFSGSRQVLMRRDRAGSEDTFPWFTEDSQDMIPVKCNAMKLSLLSILLGRFSFDACCSSDEDAELLNLRRESQCDGMMKYDEG